MKGSELQSKIDKLENLLSHTISALESNSGEDTSDGKEPTNDKSV